MESPARELPSWDPVNGFRPASGSASPTMMQKGSGSDGSPPNLTLSISTGSLFSDGQWNGSLSPTLGSTPSLSSSPGRQGSQDTALDPTLPEFFVPSPSRAGAIGSPGSIGSRSPARPVALEHGGAADLRASASSPLAPPTRDHALAGLVDSFGHIGLGSPPPPSSFSGIISPGRPEHGGEPGPAHLQAQRQQQLLQQQAEQQQLMQRQQQQMEDLQRKQREQLRHHQEQQQQHMINLQREQQDRLREGGGGRDANGGLNQLSADASTFDGGIIGQPSASASFDGPALQQAHAQAQAAASTQQQHMPSYQSAPSLHHMQQQPPLQAPAGEQQAYNQYQQQQQQQLQQHHQQQQEHNQRQQLQQHQQRPPNAIGSPGSFRHSTSAPQASIMQVEGQPPPPQQFMGQSPPPPPQQQPQQQQQQQPSPIQPRPAGNAWGWQQHGAAQPAQNDGLLVEQQQQQQPYNGGAANIQNAQQMQMSQQQQQQLMQSPKNSGATAPQGIQVSPIGNGPHFRGNSSNGNVNPIAVPSSAPMGMQQQGQQQGSPPRAGPKSMSQVVTGGQAVVQGGGGGGPDGGAGSGGGNGGGGHASARKQGTASQAGKEALMADTDGSVYQVKFKRNLRHFLVNKPSGQGARQRKPVMINVGSYVKVEADRGEDLGVVVAKVPVAEYIEESATTAGHKPRGFGSIYQDTKRIVRAATPEEKIQLMKKLEEEDQVLKTCRAKVRQRNLPMHVIDAEYQFDRHKLTFFFEADRRIDFRELVRDLFSVYKTRIWLQQLDGGNASASPAGSP